MNVGQLSIGVRGYGDEVFYLGIAGNFSHGTINFWTQEGYKTLYEHSVVDAGFQTGIGFGFRESLLGVRDNHSDKEVFTFGVTVSLDILLEQGKVIQQKELTLS